MLAFARVLFTNGESTEKTVVAAGEVASAVGLRGRLMPRWGNLQLTAWDKKDDSIKLVSVVEANPTNVDMDRVADATRAAEELAAGRMPPEAAREAVSAIAAAPPAPTWLFALAAGAGAARWP